MFTCANAFGVIWRKVHTTLSSLVNNVFLALLYFSHLLSRATDAQHRRFYFLSLGHRPGVRRDISDKSAGIFLLFALATLFLSNQVYGEGHATEQYG